VRRVPPAALAAVPGVLLALAAALGAAPILRDLPTYFVPLRERTAAVLAGARGPFWNPDIGAGEPYFANPQAGLLYPPAWLAAVLPAERAVGVEAGLHLALLAAGCATLAGRLGVGRGMALAAGWSAIVAGPTVGAVGMLNNLETLAWLPWLWWAALGRRPVAAALFAAAGFLAAEPALTATGAAIALTLAPGRRTVAALVLAGGLVAAQALPFLAWVHEGDRGPGLELAEAKAGVVLPGELAAVVAPGAPLPDRLDWRFVDALAVPLWVIVLGAAAAVGGRGPARRLAWWGFALVTLAVVPSFDWGAALWRGLTHGMVRYPGRLLFVAVVALAPAAAAATTRLVWPRRRAAIAAVLCLVVGLALLGKPFEVAVQAAATGVVLAGPGSAAAALAAAVALAGRSVGELHLGRSGAPPQAACLAAQRGAGRVYAVPTSRQQFAWIAAAPVPRMTALGYGYTPLHDGRRTVRTFAPLQARALAEHLARADAGPVGRWWLDALAASRLVAHHPVAGFPEVCRAWEFAVFDNPAAWREVQVVRAMPSPNELPLPAGEVLASDDGDAVRRWRVAAAGTGALLLWSATPDPGWRMTVDGVPADVRRGPGILQGIPVPAGEHTVEARYRPPGLVAGSIVSIASLVALLFLARRGRRAEVSGDAAPAV
jgi:hypothetical protein